MGNDSKIAGKIKAQITRFSNWPTEGLKKPDRRFVREAIYGIQASKDVKLSNIRGNWCRCRRGAVYPPLMSTFLFPMSLFKSYITGKTIDNRKKLDKYPDFVPYQKALSYHLEI